MSSKVIQDHPVLEVCKHICTWPAVHADIESTLPSATCQLSYDLMPRMVTVCVYKDQFENDIQ